jgi:hypothetical protein
MKKYKLLKDLPFVEKWEIIDYNDDLHIHNHLLKNGRLDDLLWEWFEEVKEEQPKFKVWDYVVKYADETKSYTYIKIYSISIINWEFCYNQYSSGICIKYIPEKDLRKPTQKELDKYFR